MAPDDYPFGEPHLPPTVSLYDKVTRRYADDLTVFRAEAVKQRGAESEEVERLLSEGGDITTMYYTDVRHAFHLDGSEQVNIESINAPRGSSDGFVMLNVRLYADGSPFVRDIDLADTEREMPDVYVLFLAAERAPFIVSYNELEGYFGPDGLEFSPVGYLEHLRKEGVSPRDLTDIEAQELLDILPQLDLNTARTMDGI